MKNLIILLCLVIVACNRSENEDTSGSKPIEAPIGTAIALPSPGELPDTKNLKSFAISYYGEAPGKDRDVYVLDLFEYSASDIERLGRRSLVGCYISSQYEGWRPDSKEWPKDAIGNCIKRKIGCWPDENWVNLNNESIKEVMKKRLDLAQSKGCKFVDFDNVDGYDNKGSGQTKEQNIEYVRFLSDEARKRGMLFSLKNSTGLIQDTKPWVDIYQNESCGEYNECDKYKDLSKPVFGITYGKCYKFPYMYVIKKSKMTHEDEVCD